MLWMTRLLARLASRDEGDAPDPDLSHREVRYQLEQLINAREAARMRRATSGAHARIER
jgi:hypothetical protein